MTFRAHSTVAVISAVSALLLPVRLFGQVSAPASTPLAQSALTGDQASPNAIWLDSLDLTNVEQEYGTPGRGRSVDGNPLRLGGVTYRHGIGTHASGVILVDLAGAATHFNSMVGVDNERAGSKQASVQFFVKVDGKTVAGTPVMRGGSAPQLISIDLAGKKRMELDVTDAGDGITDDHADWAGAEITLSTSSAARPRLANPATIVLSPARLTILPDSPIPAIHGPKIVGTTPGKPFIFMIPATGQKPLKFAARNLPSGLTLDTKSGIIKGSVRSPGTTRATLTASNARGKATRTLTIVAGKDKLAQTPPMGWNSWNVWGVRVDSAKVSAAADAMVNSGLAAHGYQYINIDDAWEAGRDAQGNILSNEKFQDMSALAEYVHGRGLRIGLYSSPGPKTCGGYTGSYQHEAQDAQTYAKWGFDYLKYDWCSYGQIVQGDSSLPTLQKPYSMMHSALDATRRDIVFSLCQYGMGSVWTWGALVGGNCWRTTGDIQDSWRSLHSIYESQNGHEKYAGHGHWNDPDMLVVGMVGWGNPHPPHLTANEQILHISMWSMLSAPLLIGCDMTKLDSFTRALLSNDEVIDIDQDALGRPAGRISMDANGGEIWARSLADGTKAVALLNTARQPQTVAVTWNEIGLHGRQAVRDLWLHRSVGTFAHGYSVMVPAHGAVLIKLRTPA